MHIRKASKSDFEFIHPLLIEVFSKGDSYVFSNDIPKTEIYNIWMKNTQRVYVAVVDEKIQGT